MDFEGVIGGIRGQQATILVRVRFRICRATNPVLCRVIGESVSLRLLTSLLLCFALLSQAADAFGNEATRGGDASRFSVRWTATSDGDSSSGDQGSEAEFAVTDRGDGSYLVAYAVPDAAEFELSVRMDGQDIAGSPFAVKVLLLVPLSDAILAPAIEMMLLR